MKILRIEDIELDWDNYLVFYNGNLFTGIAYELTNDGKLWTEMSYVDGMQDGLTREWYQPSGKLKAEDHYIRAAPQSKREWFEDGKLKSDAIFEFGILVSKKEWDADGNIIETYQISEEHPYYDMLIKRRKESQETSD